MSHLDTIITNAQDLLNPRAYYARDVIAGKQRWSGADLKGKARRYGGHYAGQRVRAAWALGEAGGLIITTHNGRHVTAARIGMDDYGNQLFATLRGTVVQTTKHRAKGAA